ncbi:hypothetical protein I79_026050 [Cricetulus griseus]|uniref:Uncharacterized protein n=1 Tax=Cricetulus griseus TaxID=10029 RepID=G3IPW6_CRIGR|nr:hypothetical protein I79_026050 [Cricetulus griseus]
MDSKTPSGGQGNGQTKTKHKTQSKCLIVMTQCACKKHHYGGFLYILLMAPKSK